MIRLIARIAAVAVSLVAALALLAPPAHAYLDPGSGSYVLQVVVGALLGAGMFFKVFWRRITATVARLVGRRRDA